MSQADLKGLQLSGPFQRPNRMHAAEHCMSVSAGLRKQTSKLPYLSAGVQRAADTSCTLYVRFVHPCMCEAHNGCWRFSLRTFCCLLWTSLSTLLHHHCCQSPHCTLMWLLCQRVGGLTSRHQVSLSKDIAWTNRRREKASREPLTSMVLGHTALHK